MGPFYVVHAPAFRRTELVEGSYQSPCAAQSSSVLFVGCGMLNNPKLLRLLNDSSLSISDSSFRSFSAVRHWSSAMSVIFSLFPSTVSDR